MEGMKLKKAPHISRKGKSKREIYLALENLRKQGYDIPPPPKKPAQVKKSTPLQQKHAGHHWILERGSWGPHRAKHICRDCDGAFIQWVKAQK
jgi:hypothetical protein